MTTRRCYGTPGHTRITSGHQEYLVSFIFTGLCSTGISCHIGSLCTRRAPKKTRDCWGQIGHYHYHQHFLKHKCIFRTKKNLSSGWTNHCSKNVCAPKTIRNLWGYSTMSQDHDMLQLQSSYEEKSWESQNTWHALGAQAAVQIHYVALRSTRMSWKQQWSQQDQK